MQRARSPRSATPDVLSGLIQRNGKSKRATAIILTVALVFSLWQGTFSVSAEERDPALLLREGLAACMPEIDLAGCQLTPSELASLYAAVLYDDPSLFHVALRLSYAAVGGRVSTVYPVYTLTGDSLTEARELYEDTLAATVAAMQSEIGVDASEAARVLWLHDHLAYTCSYDTRDTPNADAYTLFRDRTGVCQAYALAFLALSRAAGLEADLVTSTAMDHAWNHVRVDGVWYHVDVTRDDPVGDVPTVNHDRLLLSDAGMAARGYHSYTCASGHACTGTAFELDGKGALEGFHTALTPLGKGFVGALPDGSPVGICISPNGIFVTARGDIDADGRLTPADLLAVYDPILPDAWRAWLRWALTEEGSSPWEKVAWEA